MRIGPVGIWEILIILVVILLIFGPRRLPEMAKGLGQSVREFRKGIRDMKNEFDGDPEQEQQSKPSNPERANPERPNDRPEPPRTPRPEGETDAPPRTARPEPADDERGPTDGEPRRTDAGA